ncbi:MAG: transporter associated domain-containing protein [Intestinimonas sp.]
MAHLRFGGTGGRGRGPGDGVPEDEESDTLGGLVFDQLSVIPEDGSKVEVDTHGLHIKVESIVDRRVDWALVSKCQEEEESQA